MDRHGTETYFLPGEGFLGESVGGREPTLSPADEAAVPPFRFSRMGPGRNQKQLGEPNRRRSREAMTVDSLVDGQMGAGFTYLGQFIDHDLTFDKTGVMEGVDISPVDIEQSRSPSLDLDSLYGAGPLDPGSAKFYSDGLPPEDGGRVGGPPTTGFDLPRVGSGANPREALIPDPRNDENLAVAQTHLALSGSTTGSSTRFPPRRPRQSASRTARKIVTKHYQWMIRTDYLPRICAPSVVTDVFSQRSQGVRGRRRPEQHADHAGRVLGRRLQARTQHDPARNTAGTRTFPTATLGQLFEFAALGGDLGGGDRAPEHLDRRLPPALQLRRAGHQSPGPRRSGRQVQQGDADRHEDRQSAAGAAGRLGSRAEEQPRLPQSAAGGHGEARHRPADGDVPEEQGRDADEAHERADPGRLERRRRQRADGRRSGTRCSRTRRCGSTSCARPSSTRAS